MQNYSRERLYYPFGTKLIYILTGMFLSLSMLLFNEKFYAGNEKVGDPLLVLTLLAGLLGGLIFHFHWENKIVQVHFASLFGYVSIGVCIGVTIIGTIYNGQNAKWFGLLCLIGIPIGGWLADDPK